MVKTNTIKKLVNGEIADADDVNQIVENAGNEGGAIPYDESNQQRATGGSESIGAASYPWGDFYISRDQHLIEVDPVSHTEASSVTFSQLRKFISQKDTPDSYVGEGEKFAGVRSDETGLEFITSPAKSNVIYDATTLTRGTAYKFENGTDLVPSVVGLTATYSFYGLNQGTSYAVIKEKARWIKIPGVTTITIVAYIWQKTAVGTIILQVDVGGQTGETGTTAALTPTRVTGTVDVSSLTDGVEYDITFSMKHSSTDQNMYLGYHILLGS